MVKKWGRRGLTQVELYRNENILEWQLSDCKIPNNKRRESKSTIRNKICRSRRISRKLGLRSISIPALGCGLGGLDWLVVKEKMVDVLNGLDDVEIVIFEPNA